MNIFAFVIGLVVVVLTMVFAFLLVIINESKKPRNKVHFYIQRGAYGSTTLYMGTPYHRCKIFLAANNKLEKFFIKKDDYKGMKYGELREVFLNLEE